MSSTTAFIRRLAGPVKDFPPAGLNSVTMRFAVPADAEALEQLAQLDSRRAPRGDVLVAEVGGELWAAISLHDNHAVADPFRPTSELVFLLLARARQLRRAQRGRSGALPRLRPARAG
jgi:hypothetical protein